MSGIGSVSMLASLAAQPYSSTRATSVDAAAPANDSGSDIGAPAASGNFSADYAMSLLAKITHASADQALTLIQSMLPPTTGVLR